MDSAVGLLSSPRAESERGCGELSDTKIILAGKSRKTEHSNSPVSIDMQIKQLFVYPIKSLRGCSLQETVLTRSGFPYDRCFMLLKVETDDQGNRKPRNMHVPHFPEMALFLTDLVLPNSEDPNGKIIVTYQIPPVSEKKGTRTLEVPLQPDVDGLEELELTMHRSSTTGYNMGSRYNDWFSECFGYPVILAYIGQNRRRVLGSMAPSAQNDANGGFLSSIIPFLGKKADDDTVLTFADCAAYLVVSETSVNDVSSRLDDGYEMDVTKFRPNIVVSGAERPWEEDFWGEIAVGESGARIALTSNCVRCVSINVSYETGTHGKTENEQVYKKLTKDRRVDKGAKYNPVFGRYGFLNGNGIVPIRVGDSVEVTRTLNERTTFDWPGLASSSR